MIVLIIAYHFAFNVSGLNELMRVEGFKGEQLY